MSSAPTALRAVWRLVRLVVHLLHGMLLMALRFPSLDAAGRQARIQWWSAGLLRAAGVALQVRGAPQPGASLLVANHVSWLDIAALHAAVPQARFVSKAEVLRWPLLGWLVKGAGTLFIARERKRDALRVVHAVAQALSAGDTVAVFPEGAVGAGPGPTAFHANLIQAAIATATPIQPALLRYADARHGHSPSIHYVGATSLLQSVWRVAKADRLTVQVDLLPAHASGQSERRAMAMQLHSALVARLHGGAAGLVAKPLHDIRPLQLGSVAFVCYRRLDSFMPAAPPAAAAIAMHEGLPQRVKAALLALGFSDVFVDRDPQSGVHAQDDWPQRLNQAIEDCDLFVALVGNRWTELSSAAGANDVVGREVRAALNHDKDILALQVDGAEMPAERQLPMQIQAFSHQQGVPISANVRVDSLAATLRERMPQFIASQRGGQRWRRVYLVLAVLAYLACAVLPNVVGAIEYGWAAWWGMARIWSALFIWPILFLPFLLLGLYRPFAVLADGVLRARRLSSRLRYLAPVLVSSALAAAIWQVEVGHPQQVPWTVHPRLAPDCARAPALATLTLLPGLASYDGQGLLRDRMAQTGDPFWLRDKCWPNILFYLTVPIYRGLADPAYLRERSQFQPNFQQVLVDAKRTELGVPDSWTAWAYRLSFAVLAWLGISGIVMAAYFAAVRLRDPMTERLRQRAAEDAALCLTYSLAMLMTWVPFRVITHYFKHLYGCEAWPDCSIDLARYLPDLLMAALITMAYLFTTAAMLARFHRVGLVLLGTLMLLLCAALAWLVSAHAEVAAGLAVADQFHLAASVPLALLAAFLWWMFNPQRVHFEDFRRPLA